MLHSATLARDLLHWSKGELRASGIGEVLLEAQRRLLVVAVETKPG